MPAEWSNGPPPADVELDAVLTGIKGLEEPYERNGRKLFLYMFEFCDEQYADWLATALTGARLHEALPSGRFLSAVLGRPIEHGEDADAAMRDAIDKPYRVVIEHQHTADGLRLNVRKVMPVYHQGA